MELCWQAKYQYVIGTDSGNGQLQVLELMRGMLLSAPQFIQLILWLFRKSHPNLRGYPSWAPDGTQAALCLRSHHSLWAGVPRIKEPSAGGRADQDLKAQAAAHRSGSPRCHAMEIGSSHRAARKHTDVRIWFQSGRGISAAIEKVWEISDSLSRLTGEGISLPKSVTKIQGGDFLQNPTQKWKIQCHQRT